MKLALTLAAGVLLVGMMALQWSRMEQQQREMALLREDMGSLARALKTMERAPSSAPPAVLAASPSLTAPVAVARAPAPAALEHEEEEAPPAPRTRLPEPEEMLAHLESSFQTEPANSDWAAKAQREVRDNLSALLPPEAIVRSLDCRASLCRLEVTYTDEAQYRQVMGHPGATSMLWKGASMTHIEKDPVRGGISAVSYLSHPERSLPLPPAAAQD